MIFFLAFCQLFFGTSSAENAGAYIRLNEKALVYLSELASEGLQDLLKGITLPTIPNDLGSITPTILEFEKPQVTPVFVPEKGVRLNLILPHVAVNLNASLRIFFFGTFEEPFILEGRNTSIRLEIHFKRNLETQTNDIFAADCSVESPGLTIEFQNDSNLALFEDNIREQVLAGVKDAVCEKTIQAIRFIDQQQVQKDPLAPLPDNTNDFKASEFAADLCAAEVVGVNRKKKPMITSPISQGPPWSFNLTLNYLPSFTDKDVTFGVNGGVLLANRPALGVEASREIDPQILGNKMVGIMVTDYVANTFFAHVFDYGIGQIEYRVEPDSLPYTLRSITRLLCSKCYVLVEAHLIEKPRVEIHSVLGVRVLLSANVSVIFGSSKSSHDVINATSRTQMTLRPSVRNSRVYGDVALTSIDVNITELGVGGALAGPLEKLMSFLIPRTLWPAIKKRVRFALHQRGVQLPMLCGVQLENLALSYAPRTAVVDTDFSFDLALFLRKFKAFLNHKAELSGKSPVYV